MTREEIGEVVGRTPFIDTHEHIIEEEMRLSAALDDALFPCDDWSVLFDQYLGDDLASAGMAAADMRRFRAPDVGTAEKFALVAPWWQHVRNTGYGQAVRRTLHALYGEDDLTAESAPRLAEKYRAFVKPGFYRTIIRDKANLEHCQVNSLQRIFMETTLPDLLPQDLSFAAFSRCSREDIEHIEKETGKSVRSLDDWLTIIDDYFVRYGPKAVAVKNQNAYQRRLNYEPVAREHATFVFSDFMSSWRDPGPEGVKALQDFLFRHCLRKATEHGLPVKLHTGFYAGRSRMPLSRLRRNAGDLASVLQDFPDTKFVLMHIGYPYQDEFIALAKHYRNVYIDMCWAWIINPAASVRFLKEFLTAAPANKIFTFGGDYIVAENIVGHAAIARQGIAQALSELEAERWIASDEVQSLIEQIMHGNARAVFPERTSLKVAV
jgi:predicted TIM-barrel fold metal-dependent hydrolase